MTPFDAWMRMASAGLDLWATGVKVGETAVASRDVIRSRSATIESALRSPLDADHVELNRMVAEKTQAFAASGASIASDMLKLQLDLFAQASATTAALMTGRAPSAAASRASMRRSVRIAERAMASAGRALDPVHKTATANARRLGR